jgi:hypothetical protein
MQFLIDDGIAVWFEGPEWDDVAEEVFRNAADRVADEARMNAPWEDRTGDARAGIRAQAAGDNGDIVLTLFHTVEYGLWLEVIQNGRFAIILPTLEQQAPRIMDETIAAINGARRGRG